MPPIIAENDSKKRRLNVNTKKKEVLKSWRMEKVSEVKREARMTSEERDIMRVKGER
jgi:hypothetical protein